MQKSSQRHRFLVLAAAGFIAAGCAGQGRPESGVQNTAGQNASLISPAEIAEMRQAGVGDVYELVNRRRPNWIQMRASQSLQQLSTTVLVYQNETKLGGIEALRGYPLASVASVRYLGASEAGMLPGAGSDHVVGAIVIRTR
jgi:hypothetical protein